MQNQLTKMVFFFESDWLWFNKLNVTIKLPKA